MLRTSCVLSIQLPVCRKWIPLLTPSQMLFCRRCHRHLDTRLWGNPVVAIDEQIISVPGRRTCATSVVRSGNRPTKVISKQSWPMGLQRADASSGPFGHVQLTATNANVRG